MHRMTVVAAAVAAVFGAASPALAADDAELAQMRRELKELRDAYEARIKSLEDRLQKAEATAGKAEATAARAEAAAVKAEATATRTEAAPAEPRGVVAEAKTGGGEAAFNPGISLILSGTYTNTSQNPDTYAIGGFWPGGDEIGPGKRSFSLGESELVISASVDPYFRGYFTAAITPDNEVEVEEAWVQTTALGSGFTVKAGRFLSSIGYLNDQHPHTWDFTNAPLAYDAFLGGQFGDDGAQVRWVAPTPVYLELGGEIGRGAGFPGSDRNKNGIGAGTAFAKLGGDLGASNSWRAGVSYLQTSPDGRVLEDGDANCGGACGLAAYSFSGESRLWGADFVWKWAPEGNPTERNFKFQAEYFWRKESGILAYDDSAASGTVGAVADTYSSRQSGWYAQGVWQFMPRWRAGLRYDSLDSGDVALGLVANQGIAAATFAPFLPHDPKRVTAMVDWSLTEFSRVRLQYARDEARADGVADNQVFLQYIMSLGAHGAHKF